jgi:hypothetical protein
VTGEAEPPGRGRTSAPGNRVKAVSTTPRTRAAAKSARSVPTHAAPAASPPGVLRRRFRIAQVAEAFGCAPRTVRSWIANGLLEREKIGNAVFIREDQIEAMLLGSAQKKERSNIKHKNRYSKNTSK